jgi:hypothetical protein
LFTLLAALLCLQAGNIHDTLYKHSRKLGEIPGFREASVGGVDGDLRIVVRVDSETAKQSVLKLLGEKPDGFAVYVLVSAPAVKRTGDEPALPSKSEVGRTVAAPRPDDKERPESPKSECDLIVEARGDPARKAGKTGRCTWARRTIIAGALIASPVTLIISGAHG